MRNNSLLHKNLSIECIECISLINCSLKIIPDKRRFLTSNNLLITICSINVTPINSGYVNAFKTIQQSSF